MKTPHRRVGTAISMAVLLFASGCASENEVGNKGLESFEEKLGGNLNEQVASPSAKPPAAPAPAPSKAASPAQAPAATQVPPKAAQQQPKQQAAPAFVITINGDNASSTAFSPSAARVFQGQVLQWVNKDAVARSVVSDDNKFDSGPIPPGKAFTFTANEVGLFNYTDGTRPYAVASFEVLKR